MLCAALRLSPTTRIGPAAIADRLHRVNTNRRNNRRSRATPPIRCCAVGFCTVLWLVMEQSTVISASALGKSVIGPEGEIRILDAVEMTVNAGASIAIVGASGSGKTTLLGLLAGLDLPSRGDIHIAGEHQIGRAHV